MANLPDRPIFAMVLPACRGRAIGDNAIRRAEAISSHFRVVIISDSFPDDVPELVETITINPKRFDYLRRFCHVPNEIAFATAARAALLKLAKTGQLAFVLAHGYTPAYFAGLWLRKKRDIPFGMFMHGHIFERPKGTYDRRTTWLYRKLAPHCYRRADLLFALSREQGELAVRAGADRARVIITPNGLDLCDIGLTRAQVKIKIENLDFGKAARCLYVGRLNPEKGVDVLLQACAMLRDSHVDFCLDIVGSGPLEKNLRELCAELKLDDAVVKFHGSVNRKDLGEYYLGHDFLFVPSISEPLGNVVLEGMASGCLVIASDTGGIPDMISNGVNGILVRPGAPREIFEGMMKLLQQCDSTRLMVASGFTRYREFGNWETIGCRIVESINNTIQSRLSCRRH